MIKQLSITAIAAALVAALIAAFTWPGEAQQRAPLASSQDEMAAPIQVANSNARYDAGMRIIHVPQPGEEANDPATTESIIDDEIETMLPPKPARKRVVTPAPPQPRRILPPPNSAPKRSVLSTPSLSDGPTPIRPLPRWRSSEKFRMPEPAASAPAPTDAVTATIPADTNPPTEMPELPAIDDDAPPPTD